MFGESYRFVTPNMSMDRKLLGEESICGRLGVPRIRYPGSLVDPYYAP